VSDKWPVSGLSVDICGSRSFPFGVAILRGDYTAGNVVTATPLTIISPTEKQEFMLSEDVSADRQKILLKANGGSPKGGYWWFLDQQPLGRIEAGIGMWWPLTAGTHEAKVVDESGRAVSVRFTCQGTSASSGR